MSVVQNLGRHRLKVAVELRNNPVAAFLLLALILLPDLGQTQGALLPLGCRSHRFILASEAEWS
jgi:hypothetical protein